MRLIDADALLNEFPPDEFAFSVLVRGRIAQSPTISAVPVVRGEWIVEATDPSNVYAYCSECHEFIDVIKTELSVCPNCGARMKEDK